MRIEIADILLAGIFILLGGGICGGVFPRSMRRQYAYLRLQWKWKNRTPIRSCRPRSESA